MSDQGQVYLAFVEGELKAERERRTALDGRGQTLVTASGVLVTLLSGITAMVQAGVKTPVPPLAVGLVLLAVALFVLAAIAGIVAGWNARYAVAATATLTRMLREHWTDSEVDARNNVATVHATTVRTLREANRFKAACVSAGLILQVLALVPFATAVVVIVGRM
ncbi:hypothetical protein [Lentzea nigeriaca]|uniref:hypothetical protein n=1 Tax=Lentzea nigeriaca TaxID=1128665 RepID=UPI00195E9E15|nr:hypothetical protein [Lentzea nigeriaca]MBM7863878.1 hypothetical protein [Lentzea nigeriaca]